MGEEIEQFTKAELLDAIRVRRKRLEEALAQLGEDQMIQPGVESNWSVKDILAHIVAWEQRMVLWVGQALRGEVPAIPATWDEVHRLNEQSYWENRDRPLAEVLADFQRSYAEALALAEAVPEEDLVDPGRFSWREGVPLARVVAANTCWHYAEHLESIQAWRSNPS
jgi:hypothetical protein